MGSLAWHLWLGISGFGSRAWDLWLLIFGLGSLALNLRFGTLGVWVRKLGIFGLGSGAWEPGILSLGEPSAGGIRGNLAGRQLCRVSKKSVRYLEVSFKSKLFSISASIEPL